MRQDILWHTDEVFRLFKKNVCFTEIVQDTRVIKQPDTLFITLRMPDKNDPNQFIEDALQKNAFVLTDIYYDDERVITVANPLIALEKMGVWRRLSSEAFFTAITGSVGKTSTKNIIDYLLGTAFYDPELSWNSKFGIPLVLSNISRDAGHAVCEIGIATPNEMEEYAEFIKPDLFVITHIGHAHIGNFTDQEMIAHAKAKGLLASGMGLLPADSPYFDIMKTYIGKKPLFTFGNTGHFTKINLCSKNKVDIYIDGKRYIYSAFNDAVAYNSIIALTSCALMGFDINNLYHKIPYFIPSKGRGQIIKINNITIIDDTFNAAPDAVIMSIKNLSGYQARTIAVIGDMLELGEMSEFWHNELVQYLNTISCVVTVGKHTLALKYMKNHIAHFDSAEECAKRISFLIEKEDVIMVKGAHAMKMHKVVDAIRAL